MNIDVIYTYWDFLYSCMSNFYISLNDVGVDEISLPINVIQAPIVFKDFQSLWFDEMKTALEPTLATIVRLYILCSSSRPIPVDILQPILFAFLRHILFPLGAIRNPVPFCFLFLVTATGNVRGC